jgi:hypothetical protein
LQTDYRNGRKKRPRGPSSIPRNRAPANPEEPKESVDELTIFKAALDLERAAEKSKIELPHVRNVGQTSCKT